MNGEFAKGKRIKVACECWFTSEGKMTPLMVKVKDEDGEIRAFRNLVVLAQEKLLGGCSLSNGVSVQDNGSDTSKVENPISIRRDALLCLMSCSLIRLMPAVLVWVSRVLA